MKLTALPGHGGEGGLASGLEAGVIVADYEFHSAQPALLQALEELPPMRFGFAQGDADVPDGAFALQADPQREEDGASERLAFCGTFS